MNKSGIYNKWLVINHKWFFYQVEQYKFLSEPTEGLHRIKTSSCDDKTLRPPRIRQDTRLLRTS